MKKLVIAIIALAAVAVSGCASYGTSTATHDTPGTVAGTGPFPSQVEGP